VLYPTSSDNEAVPDELPVRESWPTMHAMHRWWLVMAASWIASCKDITETHDECRCGTAESASTLSCSAKNLCEGNFEVVGSSDLGARGMNSAIALAGNYAYIGSRTEGVTHRDAGIMIVDISTPSAPHVVGEVGPPDSAVLGMSSRELRAVPSRNLLFVLNFACSGAVNDCSRDLNQFPTTGGVAETDNLKIFDITDPIHPALLSRYDFHNQPDSVPYVPPHEFFLWQDPNDPNRTLLYVSHINGPPGLEVIDASVPTAPVKLTTWDVVIDGQLNAPHTFTTSLHSASVSDDGRIVYLAHYGVGFMMLSADSIVDRAPAPHLEPLTPVAARVITSPPYAPETHSAIKVPGRNLVLLTDEVYPIDIGEMGCPWGWGWMVDITDPRAPHLFTTTDHATGETTILGQLRLPWNEKSSCPPEALQRRTDYTAHNPTVTRNLAILSWYAAGVQAFDLTDPVNPVQVGAFYPDPIPSVPVEDPALGATTTEMWSYPIFKDGLIYVVDIRNGLYILRYTGPHAEEVAAQPFLEGNSNVR
jgi:hypothetical protein